MLLPPPRRSPSPRSTVALLLLGFATMLAACSPKPDSGPVVVSAIGAAPALASTLR